MVQSGVLEEVVVAVRLMEASGLLEEVLAMAREQKPSASYLCTLENSSCQLSVLAFASVPL